MAKNRKGGLNHKDTEAQRSEGRAEWWFSLCLCAFVVHRCSGKIEAAGEEEQKRGEFRFHGSNVWGTEFFNHGLHGWARIQHSVIRVHPCNPWSAGLEGAENISGRCCFTISGIASCGAVFRSLPTVSSRSGLPRSL